MIGAIAGDIVGSVYKHTPIESKDFPLLHPGIRARGRLPPYGRSQGLISSTPAPAKLDTLRVATAKPCARAIAAIRPSSCGTVLPARRASAAICA
jgi:hypothetical protein